MHVNLKFHNFVRKMLLDQISNQQLSPLELSLSIGLFWQGKWGNHISEYFWCYSSRKIWFLEKFPLFCLVTVDRTITIHNENSMKILKMLYLGAQEELCDQPLYKSIAKQYSWLVRSISKPIKNILTCFSLDFRSYFHLWSSVRSLSMPPTQLLAARKWSLSSIKLPMFRRNFDDFLTTRLFFLHFLCRFCLHKKCRQNM